VTFARTSSGLGKTGMSEQEYKEWLYIQAHEPVTRAQFAQQFDLPARSAQNHLSRLVEIGMVLVKGKGKAVRYYQRKPQVNR
jgi:predicted ArsR family transcriptional regulator